MKILGRKKPDDERSVRDCIQLVELFLRNVGLNPREQRLPDPDTVEWYLERGSASAFIGVSSDDSGETVLEIVCPILLLPTQNILPFYRRCLEINRYLAGCALCVNEDQVAVLGRRYARGLEYSELEILINMTTAAADSLDNKLAEEFGAKLWGLR